MSFRNRIHENDAELSTYIWSLKDQKKDFEVLYQNRVIFASWKSQQFQRARQVTQ